MTEVFNKKRYEDSLCDFAMVMMNYFGDEKIYYGGIHKNELLDIMFNELTIENMLYLLPIIIQNGNTRNYVEIDCGWMSSDKNEFREVWYNFWLFRKLKFDTIEEIHKWMYYNDKQDTMCRMNRCGQIGEIIVERYASGELGKNVLYNRSKYIPLGVYPY